MKKALFIFEGITLTAAMLALCYMVHWMWANFYPLFANR